jgi:hypothetical protein
MIAAAPERPRDPWVFRCVLDKNPRMVVIALHDDLYAAYDASTCSLYKVWRGGVKFDGAVYTTVHGPQPTSEGSVLFEATSSSSWQSVSKLNGERQPMQLPWRGYRLVDDRVWLQYGNIEESIDVILEDGKPAGIKRTFRAVDGGLVMPRSRSCLLVVASGPQPGLASIDITSDRGGQWITKPDNTGELLVQVDVRNTNFEIRMHFQHDDAGE